MKSPYQITPNILYHVTTISERIGEIKTIFLTIPPAQLRRQNRIKTIHSSLVIEGNTLDLEQVTAIVDNKRVLAPKKDILEVQNAIKAYDQLSTYKPYKISSLLNAHKALVQGLTDDAGKFRARSVGIAKGEAIAHIAPPAHLVKGQIESLLKYVAKDDDLILIKSCVFHYEFEFIHPFSDGNGRMGRLWQTVILCQQYPVFEFLPIELLIKERQKEYYRALAQSDREGKSTIFIEFMLSIILDSLDELLSTQQINVTAENRIEIFKTVIGTKEFSRKDYMNHFKTISSSTASRDLRDATEQEILMRKGEGRLTTYQYN